MAEPTVLYELKGQVALITLNRPKALNSLSKDLVTELIAALFKAEHDEQARVIVLTGAGRAFCAGGDLNGLDSLHTIDERRAFITHVGYIVKVIHDLAKPVIAMVNGVAAGAGFNLAIACDLVFCADNAKFIQSFVNVGLSPDCGGFYYLAKAVGLAKAKELMMTARPVDAQEAKQLNLVNDVFAPEELEEKGCRVFSHWRTPVSRDPEIFYKENSADAFFTSCNAITLDGEILNMDGFGNRLSGLCYGPKEVFILCGVNKFVKDRSEGMERIYHTAFPLNSQRLHGASPCASDGKCRHCPAEICKKSGYLLSLSHPAQGRTYHLFVADEPLGF